MRKAAKAELSNAPDTKRESRSAEELLHELRVNQIELEMQNEQLRQSQISLENLATRLLTMT